MQVTTRLQVMQLPQPPRDGTVHSARMEHVFVNFDAFAANFGCCFVNFVCILTLYDTRNAMRRSQCEHCAASERQNMHFHFANHRSFLFYFAAMSSVVCRLDQGLWRISMVQIKAIKQLLILLLRCCWIKVSGIFYFQRIGWDWTNEYKNL